MEKRPEEIIDMYSSLLQGGGTEKGTVQELEVRLHPNSPDISFDLVTSLGLAHKKLIDAVELSEGGRRGVRKDYITKKSVRYSKRTSAKASMDIGSLVLSEEADLDEEEELPRFLSLIPKHRFTCHLSDYPGWDLDVDISRILDTQDMGMLSGIRSFLDMDIPSLRKEVERNPSLYLLTIEFEHKGKTVPKGLDPMYIDKMTRAVIESVSPVVSNKTLYAEELAIIGETLAVKRTPRALRDILPQAKDLGNIEYVEMYPPVGYRVTEKADGIRCLISIFRNKIVLLHKEYEEFPIAYSAERTIADAEVVVSGKERLLLIFDVLMLNGDNVTGMTLDSRMQKIRHVVNSVTCPGLKAVEKEHIALDNPAKYKEIFSGVYGKKRSYGVDGLILTERSSPYFSTSIHKWKPRSEQTVDFLLKKLPQFAIPSYPSQEGKTCYVLYCTMSYFEKDKWKISFIKGHGLMTKDIMVERPKKIPVHFSNPLYPMGFLFYSKDGDLDGKIAEMAVSTSLTLPGSDILIDWELRKVREDKEVIPGDYYGNSYSTAWGVFLNCIDGISLETLWTGVLSDTYFLTSKGDSYKAPVSLISYAKTKIIEGLESKVSVIDISSGKGQDLERYVRSKVKKLVVCDIDKGAIVQLLKRWMALVLGKGTSTELGAFVVDIRDPWEKTFDLISEKFDNLVCNLAVHYFLENAAAAANFASLCSSMVNEGGTASFTCMDGEKVFSLIKKGDYVAEENGSVKYSIQKKYNDSSLEPFGQKIGVLLPFSKGDHFIEYLVNIPAFAEMMKHHGFELMEKTELLSFEQGFLDSNPKYQGKLTEADRINLSLYCCVKFRKT